MFDGASRARVAAVAGSAHAAGASQVSTETGYAHLWISGLTTILSTSGAPTECRAATRDVRPARYTQVLSHRADREAARSDATGPNWPESMIARTLIPGRVWPS